MLNVQQQKIKVKKVNEQFILINFTIYHTFFIISSLVHSPDTFLSQQPLTIKEIP